MMRVLELLDETGPESVPTGDTATLMPNGRVKYNGIGVKSLIAKRLPGKSADEVFTDMDGWSNGYATLRERKD